MRAISTVLATSKRDASARVLAHEARDLGHHQVIADAQRGAHAQLAHRVVTRELVLELARLLLQGLGPRADRTAEVAQLQALAEALEELDVELALQIGERAADRRLRHRQLFGGAAHAFVLRDRQENLELAQGVSHIGKTE